MKLLTMKHIYILLLLFCTFYSSAQKKTELIESSKLGKTRQISIITPPSYEYEKNKKYPVIYLLDGEYLMDPFNGALQYGYYFDDLPEVIIVGINQNKNNDRYIDSKTTKEGFPDEKSSKFYEFIASEVVPYVNQNYRTVSYKVIAGHDLTAGFLNFFLYKDNPVFDSYISLSPELAFEMETRVADRLKMMTKPISYFQATSSADEKSLYEKAVLLDENLKTTLNLNLSYKFLNLDGYSHYSLVPIAIPQALYHVFKGYQPINKDEYKTELKSLNSGYVEYLSAKYKKINDLYGVEMKIRLIDFLAIQSAIYNNGTAEELKELEKIASKEYPKTTLPYFIESAYYEKTSDFNGAIKAIEKGYNAKEIGPLTKSVLLEKLESLKRKRAGSNE
jgi:predicted alpha/beta superfamily hydrolase